MTLHLSSKRPRTRLRLAHACSAALAAGALVGLSPLAQAQMTSGSGEAGTGYSLLPYTQQGYVGINLGRPNYDLTCGAFSCDDPNTSVKVYTGGMFSPYFGAELGYIDLGEADRFGGDARARGLNLSLVGRLPVASNLSLFAKLGTTYGRTEIDASPLALVRTGKDSGWGPSYGIGASFDFHRNWSAVAEWERHEFHFVGQGREPVSTTSIGVKYRF